MRVLREAVRALESAKRAAARAKMRRTTTYHSADVDNYYHGRNGRNRAMCGQDLGATPNGRRVHATSYMAETLDCAECVRLVAMLPEEREQERKDRSETLAAKFAGKNDDRKKAAEAKRALQDASIAEARVAALVAQDAYLEGREYPDIDTILRLAMVARSREEPSHMRLWHRMWRWDRPWSPGLRGEQRVRCRFCNHVLGHGRQGYNYSHAWFTADGVERHSGHEGAVVSVARHTTLCALAYLHGQGCAEPLA